MSYFNEYGLLVAVALPVLVIAGMQVLLFLGGERGTLLVPGASRYPHSSPVARAAVLPMRAVAKARARVESANEMFEREAA
jgi:hypothetical protein